jgi:hypothetical protein
VSFNQVRCTLLQPWLSLLLSLLARFYFSPLNTTRCPCSNALQVFDSLHDRRHEQLKSIDNGCHLEGTVVGRNSNDSTSRRTNCNEGAPRNIPRPMWGSIDGTSCTPAGTTLTIRIAWSSMQCSMVAFCCPSMLLEVARRLFGTSLFPARRSHRCSRLAG